MKSNLFLEEVCVLFLRVSHRCLILYIFTDEREFPFPSIPGNESL